MKYDGGELIENERIAFIGETWVRILELLDSPNRRELIKNILVLFENGEISLSFATEVILKC